MKNLILVGILCLGLTHSFGQQAITYKNDPPIINPITQAAVEGMRAALLWAPISDPNNFVQLGASINVGFPNQPGVFQGSVLSPQIGAASLFTAHGWEVAYGATYEAAAAAPAMNGRTALLFTCNTLQYPPSGGSAGIIGQPADLVFQCAVVPEPSTVTLTCCGGLALLLAVLKKRLRSL